MYVLFLYFFGSAVRQFKAHKKYIIYESTYFYYYFLCFFSECRSFLSASYRAQRMSFLFWNLIIFFLLVVLLILCYISQHKYMRMTSFWQQQQKKKKHNREDTKLFVTVDFLLLSVLP